MRGKIPNLKTEGVKFKFNQNRGGKTAFKPKQNHYETRVILNSSTNILSTLESYQSRLSKMGQV